MLFLVKQVHTPDRCPKDVGGTKTLYDAAAAGVRLDRVFGDFSRHTIYYLLEADFVEDVQKFLAPGWLSCTSEVIPCRRSRSAGRPCLDSGGHHLRAGFPATCDGPAISPST